MRIRSLIVGLIALVILAAFPGCSAATAPAPYKAANKSRLAYCGPILLGHASTQPANVAQRDRDVVNSWQIEVNAQQGK